MFVGILRRVRSTDICAEWVGRYGRVSFSASDRPQGTASEVFAAFLKLGLTSDGGPAAHIGYFRDQFVVRPRRIDETAYADLVAPCQFLPGPASSQVIFALVMPGPVPEE